MTRPKRMKFVLRISMYARLNKIVFNAAHRLHINETLNLIEIIKSSAQPG